MTIAIAVSLKEGALDKAVYARQNRHARVWARVDGLTFHTSFRLRHEAVADTDFVDIDLANNFRTSLFLRKTACNFRGLVSFAVDFAKLPNIISARSLSAVFLQTLSAGCSCRFLDFECCCLGKKTKRHRSLRRRLFEFLRPVNGRRERLIQLKQDAVPG